MVIDRVRLGERLARKAGHAGWMLRYWVMDKYRERLALLICASAGMIAAACAAVLAWLWLRPRPEGMVMADGGISAVVYLIIMIVAMVVAYAMAPKPEPAKPVEGKTPEVEDGKAVRRVYGTVWVDDSAILAWKNLDPEPIRKKGGKK